MTALRSAAIEFLRDEFAKEWNAGFPRLKRIPDTQVVKCLDYFAGLDAADQADLRSALARVRSGVLFQEMIAQPPEDPAYRRFTEATGFGGFGGGYRYTPVRLLAGIAKDQHIGGLDGWFQKMNCSGRCLQPPEGLLSDLSCLKPIKPVALRKLVNAVFAKLFAPEARSIGGGFWQYQGTLGDSRLKVHIDYSQRIEQLRYSVNLHDPSRSIAFPHLTLELIWGIGCGGWNYLTEENATRSVELLGELVAYLAELPRRMAH